MLRICEQCGREWSDRLSIGCNVCRLAELKAAIAEDKAIARQDKSKGTCREPVAPTPALP